MKNAVSLAVLAMVVGTIGVGHADPVEGTILLPTAGAGRVQRCAWTTGGENQGVFGYTVDVTPGAAFALSAANPDTDDFDIAFYKEVNACEEDANVVDAQHENGEGDEAGAVPADATQAVIMLFTGLPNAAFTYTETV